MDSRFQNLSAAQLRTIIIYEMRKFALALEYGSTLSDLQEIKEQIKLLGDALAIKENEETMKGVVEPLHQSNSDATVEI